MVAGTTRGEVWESSRTPAVARHLLRRDASSRRKRAPAHLPNINRIFMPQALKCFAARDNELPKLQCMISASANGIGCQNGQSYMEFITNNIRFMTLTNIRIRVSACCCNA